MFMYMCTLKGFYKAILAKKDVRCKNSVMNHAVNNIENCVTIFMLSCRRLMQIDQENKHTMSLPHLSGPEKDAIMREKYLASMKPVSPK